MESIRYLNRCDYVQTLAIRRNTPDDLRDNFKIKKKFAWRKKRDIIEGKTEKQKKNKLVRPVCRGKC